MNHRDKIRDLSVLALLVAIGVVGRWAQPDWNFTPLHAVTLLGGFYFSALLPAICLPLCILAISDVALSAHDNFAVQFAVYAMMLLPLALGRIARNMQGWKRVGHGVLCGFLPATAFFVVTNFVHWTSTSMYQKTWEGLAACYSAAIPFYRSMLAGDLLYLAVLVACLVLAGMKNPELVRVRVR